MTTAQAESTIPTGTWQSDPVHSSVGFSVRHAVGTFRGSFGEFEATFSDASGESKLTGHVPVESVQVNRRGVVAEGELNGPIAGPDGNDRLGIDLETTVDRHDYGLDWNMDLPDGTKMLGDEVTLTVHLELVKEA